MNVKAILANPTVQAIIKSINEHCDNTLDHCDRYGFLSKLCEVCYEGETKTVFLNDKWDFVIKVPNYNHYRGYNYCALEVKHYQSAIKYRVERVLLETAVLAELPNGITLYVQPRYQQCNGDYRRNRQKNKALIKKINNDNYHAPTAKALDGMYESYRIDKIWFCRVVQLYGKKFARSLEAWSKENKIGDLHNSNTGWHNDKPIILDYAGYYGGRY